MSSIFDKIITREEFERVFKCKLNDEDLAQENFIDIATEEELKDTYGELPTENEISLHRFMLAKDRDLNFQKLYLLFLERGDKNKAHVYFEQIQDYSRKLEATMLVNELRD